MVDVLVPASQLCDSEKLFVICCQSKIEKAYKM